MGDTYQSPSNKKQKLNNNDDDDEDSVDFTPGGTSLLTDDLELRRSPRILDTSPSKSLSSKVSAGGTKVNRKTKQSLITKRNKEKEESFEEQFRELAVLKELEERALANPKNGVLQKEVLLKRNSFDRLLFDVYDRVGKNRVTSTVWKYDYCRQIRLSNFGKQYVKDSEYIFVLFALLYW